ncbi:cell division regulator GpsB [Jeotgalibaca ciconiae]|uniref:Cell cycle protein GpsB n=1 Tax=Jeotgalibaca ciconiae TaxID=2496265 RepID=A0A3S9HDR1_9LACT|nr:cell division regulator GpsB [Jeotgalibaca ciconiae]AZP05471.1 cell division regulator GpsB [Jeotgalibaca ciconiae]HJB24179.1 cell division regulator GpsB [Candidatus Jeotgalibaca pullicola]
MADKNLTTKDILQKEFKNSMRGYNVSEVDEFLDMIIRDYESYQKDIAYLQSENERMRSRVDELTKQAAIGKRTQSSASPGSGVTNFDILKRLSNLEKHVFGSKLEDRQDDEELLND